jgi:hypothetical protein
MGLPLTSRRLLSQPNTCRAPLDQTSQGDKVTDEHDSSEPSRELPAGCPVRWLAADIGRFRSDEDDLTPRDAEAVGREALARAARDVEDLLGSAFAPHEVVATEVRLAGPRRGFRRTVFALPPSPGALLLLCLRLCDGGDGGDDVAVLQHTAAHGTTTRSERWPFGMADAERLTRPPERHSVPLPEGLRADG